MATAVNILFTGICLFLTDKDRVILGVAKQRLNCLGNMTIPEHYPCLMYDVKQRINGKTGWKSNGVQEAVLLSGLIEFSGKFVETQVKYPGSAQKLPNVVATKEIAPTYTPRPTVLEDNPANINPAIVAARVDLPPGNFQLPYATEEFWHFFPPKNSTGIRMQIAQAVQLTLHVTDAALTVTERPFGSGGAPSNVVTLNDTAGTGILIVIGNSSEPDIVSKTVNSKPATGPDHDFELHWNLFNLNSDPECPPISYNEGRPGSGTSTTLGGGNCPPSRWP